MPMERLRQRADFLAAATGIKIPAASFVLQAKRRDDQGPARFGFTVTKKVGNAVERASTRESAYEILVQLPTGERRSIIQAQGKETFTPGDAVILVTTSGKTRVMKAPPNVAPQTAPTKS